MPDLASLTLQINSNQVNEARGALQNFAQSGQAAEEVASRLGATNEKLASGYAGLIAKISEVTAGVGLLGLAFKAIEQAADLEQTQLAFDSIIGDLETSHKLIAELIDYANHTPFQFKGLAENARILLAMGYNAQEVIPLLKAVGDVAALSGQGAQQMDRLTYVLSRIRSEGQVTSRTLMELGLAGVNAKQYLADALGESVPEAMKRMQTGSVSLQTFMTALMTGLNRDFRGGAAALAQTVSGLFTTLKDNIYFAMTDVGTVLSQSLDIKGWMRLAIEQTEKWKEVLVDVVDILAGYPVKFEEAANAASKIAQWVQAIGTGVLVIVGAQAAIGAVGAIIALIATVLDPLNLVVLAIAAAAAAFVYFKDQTIDFGGQTVTVLELVKVTWALLVEFITEDWQTLKEFLLLVLNEFADYFTSQTGNMKITWTDVWNSLKSIVKDVINYSEAGIDTLSDALDLILQRMAKVAASIASIDLSNPSAVLSSFGKLGVNITSGASGFANDLANKAITNFQKDYVGAAVSVIKTQIDKSRQSSFNDFVGNEAVASLQQAVAAGLQAPLVGRTKPELSQEQPNEAQLQLMIDKLKEQRLQLGLLNGEKAKAEALAVLEKLHISENTEIGRQYLEQVEALSDAKREQLGINFADKLRDEAALLGLNAKAAELMKEKQGLLNQGYVEGSNGLEKLLARLSAYQDLQFNVKTRQSNVDLTREISNVGKTQEQVGVSNYQDEVSKAGQSLNNQLVQDHIQLLHKQADAQREYNLSLKTQDLQTQIDTMGMGNDEIQIQTEKLQLLREGWDLNSPAVQKYLDKLQELARDKEINQLAASMANSFGNAFESMITGTKSFSAAVKQMVSEIEHAILQSLVVKPLVSALTTGLSGLGGALSGVFTAGAGAPAVTTSSGSPASLGSVAAMGNVYWAGQRLSAYADGGVVTSPTYFPMATGMGLMGEAGPEAVMPLQRDAEGKLGVRGGGSSTINNIQITVTTPNADSFRRSTAQIASDVKRRIGN